MGRPLEGRAALVTGAGVRLGRAIALHLGRLGANVAVHHFTSAAPAEEVAATIRVDGNRSVALKADLADEGAIASLVAAAAKELGGPVSVLVNSAGILGAQYTPDDLWRVNARAPYLLTREVAQQAPDSSDVVFILDILGTNLRWKSQIPYTMSKAAAAEGMRALALALAPKVRVNGVSPGAALPQADATPEELDRLRARIPQQRFGSPEDVAQTVGMLLTGPRFVTGQIVAVDGGRSLA